MTRTLRIALLAALLSAAATTLPAQNLLLRLGGGLASQGSDARPVGAFQIGVGYCSGSAADWPRKAATHGP